MSHAAKRQLSLGPAHLALLVAVCLALFLPGFFTLPPFDRDEARYAQATHQMLETGDFVDIRFQEEARWKKPVGIYWMQAASVTALTGGADTGPIWMYRIPSLLGAIAAVLFTAWAGARLFGATVGVAGALMLASTLILGVEARLGKTDAMLLATIVASQAALARIYLDRDKPLPPGLGIILLFWVGLGVGLLVKGLNLVVVGSTVLALCLMDRRVAWLRLLRPVLGIPVMLAIVLPWLVAIGIATDGGFFRYAIGHELLGKVHSVQENHGAPPGYYLATVWITFWPWGLFVALALPWVWRNRMDPAVRFCVAWIVPTWILFEAAVTKLPHYTMPVFPALALLAAAAGLERLEGTGRRNRPALLTGLLLAGIGTLALAGAAAGLPFTLEGRWEPTAVAAAVAVLATFGVLVAMERLREPNRLIAGGVGGAVLSFGLIFGAMLPNLDPVWLSPLVQRAVGEHRPCPNSRLAAAGYTEPSMVFLVGTNTRLGDGAMVADHLAADPACAIGLVTEGPEMERFRAALAERGLTPRELVAFSGFNYSRGRAERLTLQTLAP